MIYTGTTPLIGGIEIFPGDAFTGQVAMPGVTVGMVATATPRTFPGNGIFWEAFVSAPGVVSVKVSASIATTANASLYDVQVNDASTPSQLQQTTITVTAAQVNGMFAAPIPVIPAQGPNTIIRVNSVLWNAVFGGAAFTGGGNLALFYTNTTPPVSTTNTPAVAAFLTAFPASQLTDTPPNMGTVASAIAVNAGVYLSNLTGPFAGGAGATLTVTVSYTVLPAQ